MLGTKVGHLGTTICHYIVGHLVKNFFFFSAEGFFTAVGTDDWMDGFACGTCAELSFRLKTFNWKALSESLVLIFFWQIGQFLTNLIILNKHGDSIYDKDTNKEKKTFRQYLQRAILETCGPECQYQLLETLVTNTNISTLCANMLRDPIVVFANFNCKLKLCTNYKFQ